MKKILCIFLGSILFLTILSGCLDTTTTTETNILVTIIPQKEMVEEIGKDLVSLTVLVPEGQSPHSYEPTPSQMIKISDAEAYFTVGSGIEFELSHLDTIIEQNPDIQIFNCSEHINIISFNEHYGQKNYNNHFENHSEHMGTDPHIWTSPLNYKKMAETVYNGLVTIDPENQEQYQKNYENYTKQLDQLHTNISTMLEHHMGKSFMTYHPAWGYFSDTYKVKQIAIEDEGKKPGPSGIAAIIEQAQNESITIIFVSPQYDRSSAQTIASEINGSVVTADPLMDNYQETISSLATDLTKGFQNTTTMHMEINK